MRASPIVPFAALVLLPARAEDGSARGSGIAIAVFMQFDEQYSAVSLGAMQQELESIMSACNLNIKWRAMDGSASKESFSDLVVARFRGKCRANVPRSPRRGQKSLGLTHLAGGEVLPFSEVDCDRVGAHARAGIAKATLTPSDLLEGRLRLAAKQSEEIRRSLRQPTERASAAR